MSGTLTTIGEVAERSGFSTSTLRYYEAVGLVTPTARSDAGYRLYDERALSRLAFIARAKHLGCTLDEIVDLLGLWDRDERCDPVQRRLHELVTAKLEAARRQIAELRAFTSQLEVVATHLATPVVEEGAPCLAGCACMRAMANVVPVEVPA